MKQTKGFTMIELIVTLAVLAILVGIAIPSYISLMPRYRLSGATRQVATDLMKARMQAVKLSTNVDVAFTTTGYTISGGSYSETFNIQSQYPGVSLSAKNNNGGADDPVFHPRGTISNAYPPVTVTLSNTSGSKQVQVNIAGRVKQL